MNNNEEKEELIKTALWTFLVALIITSISIVDLGVNTQTRREASLHQQVDLQNKHLELQKLYYLEKTEKNNYMISLKIALLHELLREYNQAEANYEKAIVKSDNNPFVIYRSAMFFATQKKYQRAIELANLLPNTEDKKIYILKAKFYSKLASSFLEDKDYVNSVKIYKIAYKYAKNSSKELKTKTAIEYANAYGELADKCISDNDAISAVQALLNAIEIYPDPLAKYKLGLIYRNVDDEKSQKYMEEAYLLNPNVVNLEIYSSILNKLIKTYSDSSNFSKARFYTLKLEHLKRKVNDSLVFRGDLAIEDFEIIHKRKFFIGKKETYVQFELKNNTKNTIDNMYLRVVMQTQNGSEYSSEAKVITRSAPLRALRIIPLVQIKLQPEIKEQDMLSKSADISVYARKKPHTLWVLVDSLTINLLK